MEINLINYIELGTVSLHVKSDMDKMFSEKNNLGGDNPYGRMTTQEFAENRKKHDSANICGWFGWDNSYSRIIAARLLNNSGYSTNAKNVSFFVENLEVLKKEIDNCIKNYLEAII